MAVGLNVQDLEQCLLPRKLSVNVIDEEEDSRVWLSKHCCFLRRMCSNIIKGSPVTRKRLLVIVMVLMERMELALSMVQNSFLEKEKYWAEEAKCRGDC